MNRLLFLLRLPPFVRPFALVAGFKADQTLAHTRRAPLECAAHAHNGGFIVMFSLALPISDVTAVSVIIFIFLDSSVCSPLRASQIPSF